MVIRIVGLLGTAASVIGLIFSLRPVGQPLTAFQGGLIGVLIFGFLLLIYSDINTYQLNQPISFDSENEINDYMYEWISKGRRVVIFTHDMSWANEDRMRRILAKKAQRNELTICLPKNIELTRSLTRYGATILTYEQLNYVPQSRFTIINKDRMDAHVAVGRRIGNKHIIEEYHVGRRPYLCCC